MSKWRGTKADGTVRLSKTTLDKMPSLRVVRLQVPCLLRGTPLSFQSTRCLGLTSAFDTFKVCDPERGTWPQQDFSNLYDGVITTCHMGLMRRGDGSSPNVTPSSSAGFCLGASRVRNQPIDTPFQVTLGESGYSWRRNVLATHRINSMLEMLSPNR